MNGPRAVQTALETVEWKDVWSSDSVSSNVIAAEADGETETNLSEDPRLAALRLREALIRHDLLITGIDRLARMNRRARRA